MKTSASKPYNVYPAVFAVVVPSYEIVQEAKAFNQHCDLDQSLQEITVSLSLSLASG